MMRSVSMSLPRIGTAVPATLVILTISLIDPRLFVLAYVDDFTIQRRRRYHHRAHQQRSPLWTSLPAYKIAIRRRRRNFPAVELIRIHRQTHRAAGFAPLKPGFDKYFMQALLLSELFYLRRTGHNQRADGRINFSSLGYFRRGAQIGETPIGARADKRHVHRRTQNRRAGFPTHMLVGFLDPVGIDGLLRLRQSFGNS